MEGGRQNPLHFTAVPMNSPGTRQSPLSPQQLGEIVRATGIRLHSVFQPIYSIPHAAAVGHEALLRGTSEEQQLLKPSDLFPRLTAHYSAQEVSELCTQLHLESFLQQERSGWLFLNVTPHTLSSRDEVYRRFGDWLCERGLPPHRVVIEIIETRTSDEQQLAHAVSGFRDLGCLVAIDDFGAGESNFERVWRLRPDIVKLDRAMLAEAAQNPLVRHILPGIVSLLHEAGSWVVLEGIETESQALLAIESNVDFVQGYYFSHPGSEAPAPETTQAFFQDLRRRLAQALEDRSEQDRHFFQSYIGGFEACISALEESIPLHEACALFLTLAGVQRVYLLDQDGVQISKNLEAHDGQLIADPRYDPCSNSQGAHWGQREYFLSALAAPLRTQISSPYLSIRDARTCITLSHAFDSPQGRQVLCADLDYASSRNLYAPAHSHRDSGVVLRPPHSERP